MDYIPRIVDGRIERCLGIFGAVLLQGPRWCGKTTTATRFAASATSLTDPSGDFSQMQLAEADPSEAIAGARPRLIDEWQEVPKLWDAVRFACDRDGGHGLYILTGSATPDDAHAPMHSGAGRFARVRMSTMTLSELGVSSGTVSLAGLAAGDRPRGVGHLGMRRIAELVVRGGWPAAVGLADDAARDMTIAYVDGVCSSDVSRIDGVRRDPGKVRRLVSSLARNESTLASMKSIVADVGDITRPTASTYLSVLERLNFVQDIPAWSPVRRPKVRLRKARKHHLADPSIAAVALGASVDSLVADPKTLGLLFESLVIHDLMVYAAVSGASVSHYHDDDDLEVDAVVSWPSGEWVPIEVRLGAGGIGAGRESLRRLEARMTKAGNRPPAAKVVVVGFGQPAQAMDDGVMIVPVDTLGA